MTLTIQDFNQKLNMNLDMNHQQNLKAIKIKNKFTIPKIKTNFSGFSTIKSKIAMKTNSNFQSSKNQSYYNNGGPSDFQKSVLQYQHVNDSFENDHNDHVNSTHMNTFLSNQMLPNT